MRYTNYVRWGALAMLGLAAPVAQAGVVFSEDFSGAPVGAITIPGSLTTTARTYATTGTGTPTPAISIINDAGNLRLENTAAGSAANSRAELTATALTGFQAGKATTIEFDIRDLTPTTTASQRFYVLVENSTSLDGYRTRFSTQVTSEEVWNATVVDNGVEVGDVKFDDSVGDGGGFGIPNANGEWHAKMTFIPHGADTKLLYSVLGINGSPDLLAPNTFTLTGAAAQDAFDRVVIWFRRPLASVDNIVISQDTEAPVITLNGNAVVNVGLGCTYSDAGATALDGLEGSMTANINTVNTVNTAVPGNYSVTYTVSDSSGNAATPVVRTVNVSANANPVVTLIGASVVNINCGAVFSDPGSTAVDACGGSLTPVRTGTLNTASPGSYTLTYTATDGNSNVGTATRTVNVQNNCPAIIITPTTSTSLVVQEGASATFGISAVGTGTLSYAWFFDNGSKAASSLGVLTPSITISPVLFSDEGTYYCNVSDGVTTLPSPLFSLNVTPQLPVAGLPMMAVAALATALCGVAGLRRKR